MQQPPSIRPAAEPALPPSSSATQGAPSAASRLWRIANKSGIVMVFVILFAVLALTVPDFLTSRNMQGLLLSVTLIGSIAVTMMFVLALGEVDLSVASIVAFSGVVASMLITATHNVLFGVVAGVVAGGAVGLVNGVLIARYKINSLIVTLAMMEVVRGLAFIVSSGDAVMISEESFFDLGGGSFLGISYPIWSNIVGFIVFGFLLRKTVFGKNVLAVGGNAEAASLAGLPVVRIKVAVFVLQGLVTGFAGVMLASRMSLGDPKTSVGLELGVISACVLGGVSLTGGVATISGVLVGVLIMGSVQNAMSLMNVPTFYQYLIRGGILLLAVLFDHVRRTRRVH
ncbi:L-arabinose ABC transporter permease AraH [Trinickia caryophylli]|uniref:L-arabinose ABC transporter membrane protein n=1 Tax=Trinickia caryophylli TaxID=28094 RepID=A0A1X7D173_TRICW|nr:L-arabinose ABC transporter permease AraH [Trinickia caryophylli]PMS13569.1 L-arabinose ABC transporter permease AraH [Trinickia caryophylli]TRX15263.1 L-arabinose ABC transporter permease AraH [Trinickia caryophylli]WQE15138.1 L-arabinose ABC transporter permease AraH [Trinickia caryophylli]SMF06787.1 L-arabinose ABC transporter membrane protein [Trinickia caryophylli]GLU31125.1 L-arabinose ABC transporter permease AraH [Trinickia caryophylli]